MKTNNLKISQSVLFLIIAMLIGGYIRLFQVLQSPFPIGDGGMFYSLTRDLIQNGFHLPLSISYNHLNVPFTYPPLAFYLVGYISTLFNLELINVFRIFPAVVSILTIPAFYLFARKIIHNDSQLSIATLIFSLVPPSFNWMIKGGGVARAPALLFSILALLFIHQLYTRNKKSDILFSSLFSALSLLTHPQTTLFTACSAVIFFLFLSRNLKGLIKSLIVAVLTLLLSAPWWLSMILRYRLAPFLNALGTGEYSILSVVRFIFGNTLLEIGLTTIGVFGLVGILWYLRERNYMLPVWALAGMLIDPRSTPRNLSLVLAICASYALVKLFWMFQHGNETWNDANNALDGAIPKIIIVIFFGQWIFSAFYTVNEITSIYSLKEDDAEAAAWIRNSTDSQSRFLVLSGLTPFDDSFSEWLPGLTGRVSIATVQGKEWSTDQDFGQVTEKYEEAQGCYLKAEECISAWETKYNEKIEYIYIRENNHYSDPDEGQYSSAITRSLLSSNRYELVFENDLVAVLKKSE